MDIILRKLHAGQEKVWTEGSEYLYNAVRCGRRWGKTEQLIIIAVSYVTNQFPIPNSNLTRAGRVGIFTPEYRQYQEIFDALAETLAPLIKTQSRSEKRILLKNGGKIDFWVTNDNKLAGRGREYECVLIDEGAFTKAPEMLEEVWPKSIEPTLLVTQGRCWVFSTPNGIDDDNFFYAIRHNPKLQFHEHYAPTSSNPIIKPEFLEKIKANVDPRVWRQEYLAEDVDWSKDALFDVNKLFVDGKPVETPKTCDLVFAVMDTAVKGGSEHDGTGIVYFAYEETYTEPRLTIVDWDVIQIDGTLIEDYMPNVFTRLDDLTRECHTRQGSAGVYIEDASMGSILLQKGLNSDWPVKPISSKLTSKGKDERGVMSSGYHYREKCKISKYAHDKTAVFKNAEANHLIKQISAFHLADKNAFKRADDLLDCYMYALILTFGDGNEL